VTRVLLGAAVVVGGGLSVLGAAAGAWFLAQLAGRAITRRLSDPALQLQTFIEPPKGQYDNAKAVAGKRKMEAREQARWKAARAIRAKRDRAQRDNVESIDGRRAS
jgi:hypothetical protein